LIKCRRDVRWLDDVEQRVIREIEKRIDSVCHKKTFNVSQIRPVAPIPRC